MTGMGFFLLDCGVRLYPELLKDKNPCFRFTPYQKRRPMKNIHIGKLIKEKFEQKSIDIELLLNISKVLEYNFIEEV
jgi:hypothetical protein